MYRKLLTIGMVLVLALLAILPAAAQDGDEIVLVISREALQAAFSEYAALGFTDKYGADVVSFPDGSVALDMALVVSEDSSLLEGLPGPVTSQWDFINAWPLRVTLQPVLNDGAVHWQIAYAELRDGAGAEVELPQDRLRDLAQTARAAWNNAFIDVARAALQAQFPDGLPGRPQIEYMAVITEIIEIRFITYEEPEEYIVDASAPTRSGEFVALRDPVRGIVDWDGSISVNEMGETVLTIPQDQVNAAFAAIAPRLEAVESFQVEIGENSLSYTAQVPQRDGEAAQMTMQFVSRVSPDTIDPASVVLVGFGDNAIYPADQITMEVASNDSPEGRAARAIVRATNQYIAMQVDLGAATGLMAAPGELVLQVAGDYPSGDGSAAARSGGPGEARRVEITEAQFNRALDIIAANNDAVDHFSMALGDGSVRFELVAEGLCNNEVIEVVGAFDGARVQSGWYDSANGAYDIFAVTCAGEPVEPAELRLGNFEIQDFTARTFGRIVQQAANGSPVLGIEIDSANGIIAILIG